jgi:hypothetical protein
MIFGEAIWTFLLLGQTGLLGQRDHRHQPGTRHEVVIVKHCGIRLEVVPHLPPEVPFFAG